MSFWKLVGAIVAAMLCVGIITYGGIFLWLHYYLDDQSHQYSVQSSEQSTQAFEEKQTKIAADMEASQDLARKEQRAILDKLEIIGARKVPSTDPYQEKFVAQLLNHSSKGISHVLFEASYFDASGALIDVYTPWMDMAGIVKPGEKGNLQWYRSVASVATKERAPESAKFEIKIVEVRAE